MKSRNFLQPLSPLQPRHAGATEAYAETVEERISELREAHVPGFQRFGVFVSRRFQPCRQNLRSYRDPARATVARDNALLNLHQTRIPVEIEFQNAIQIQAMADRAATQIGIQRAARGSPSSRSATTLVRLTRTALEAGQHAGVQFNPLIMLGSVLIVIAAVTLAVLRVKHALSAHA